MVAQSYFFRDQDEFIYILEGTATLIFGEKRIVMNPGDCMGFPSGQPIGHCLVNETNSVVKYLEVGDRSANDCVEYPGEDLKAEMNQEGKWEFFHKDGTPFE